MSSTSSTIDIESVKFQEEYHKRFNHNLDFPPTTKIPDIHKPWTSYILVSLLCLFVAMGGFIFGYDTGTISGYINMPVYLSNFGEQNSDGEFYFSNVRSGLIVGTFSIGACIGGVVFAKLGDIYGRKIGIMVGTTIYIIGTIVQISASSAWYQIMIGRIIGGLGIGTIAVLVPMFQSESAPQEIRGTLVSSYQLMITLGIFVGYCVCYGTSARNDTSSYRIPLGLNFLWAIILISGLVFVPESARYLISKDSIEEAKRSMAFINRADVNDPLVISSINKISSAVEQERLVGKAHWSELITGKPRVGYRLMVGVVILAMQQLTGANFFFYYGTKLFKDIGMENSFATSMIFGAVNFVSTFFGLWFIERFGRRNVLFWGAGGMCAFFILYSSLGAKALHPHPNETNDSVGKGMIAVTCFYIFCFATTWAPCAYVLVSEIFPLRIRSKGMSIGLGANWLANFLLAFFSSMIDGAIHFYYGFVFVGCLLFSMVFVYLFVHETKGLSLEQVDEMFASGLTAWSSSSFVPKVIKCEEPKVQEV